MTRSRSCRSSLAPPSTAVTAAPPPAMVRVLRTSRSPLWEASSVSEQRQPVGTGAKNHGVRARAGRTGVNGSIAVGGKSPLHGACSCRYPRRRRPSSRRRSWWRRPEAGVRSPAEIASENANGRGMAMESFHRIDSLRRCSHTLAYADPIGKVLCVRPVHFGVDLDGAREGRLCDSESAVSVINPEARRSGESC